MVVKICILATPEAQGLSGQHSETLSLKKTRWRGEGGLGYTARHECVPLLSKPKTTEIHFMPRDHKIKWQTEKDRATMRSSPREVLLDKHGHHVTYGRQRHLPGDFRWAHACGVFFRHLGFPRWVWRGWVWGVFF